MGGINRSWSGLLAPGLGKPPGGSVEWGKGRRFDAWRDPDPAGHWVPTPPYPRASDGHFAPIDRDVLPRARWVAGRLTLGLRIPDIAADLGVSDRTLRTWLTAWESELERERLLVAGDAERQDIANVLAAIQRGRRPGRPRKAEARPDNK
jgi:hypothetical protein